MEFPESDFFRDGGRVAGDTEQPGFGFRRVFLGILGAKTLATGPGHGPSPARGRAPVWHPGGPREFVLVSRPNPRRLIQCVALLTQAPRWGLRG